MTPFELARLLEYIKKNNRLYEEKTHAMNRRGIKYVDACFDTRDCTVWRISFRCIAGHDDISFRIESEEDIAKVYKFLDEPFK